MTAAPDEANPKPPDPEEGPAATSFDAETVNHVQTYLSPSKMNIETALFGVDNRTSTSRARATGRVTDQDIAEAITTYAAPDCYPLASKALENENAVVLHGPADVGKRASAIMLLRERTDGPIILLSPQLDLTELGDRDYDKGSGYALVDHIVVPTTSEQEFEWRVVRERLVKAGAYLVVTTTTSPSLPMAAVQHVAWGPPRPDDVLAKRTSIPLSEDDLDTLTKALAGSIRMRDVVELANRLTDGESMVDAVGHLDQTARSKVSAWFDGQPSRRQISEVTALAFALGADDRHFESVLASLEQHLLLHMPEPESTEDVPQETSLPQRRHLLTGPDSLIVRRTVTSELGPRTELAFASSSLHRHVLAVLWERMEVAFWDAVREWLNRMTVLDGGVGFGLAGLAEVAFAEVRTLLVPWSRGSRGLRGQWVAILVLSTMAVSNELAPAALQTSTKWINSDNAAQRWTAAVAFSGDLGRRFPHEAVNRLWQLCTQPHTSSGDPSFALARLFSSLASNTPDAGIVLSTLDGKLRRFRGPGGNVVMQAVAMKATLAVLSVQDDVRGRRAFLRYLDRSPDRIGVVAKLWVAVLGNSPTRRDAIRSLRDAVEDISDHHENPSKEAARLGGALAAEMTAEERVRLEAEMRRITKRERAGNNEVVTVLFTTLLKALIPEDTVRKETR
ncbi:hypothetical protein [Amycolatopsis sp. TNS106]|uniref:hypothetical protein n=1 Tax=Amycolatopsis sp. TNS106 TaxID=2861750 RepID=UPI001C57F3C4|nr:hypothetical protein [Amycolatopsis sp. TNS106]QXV60308.1 hypothetical protein CVV72_27100 [Amycolatopsis sp. TNS106]